MSRNSSFRFDTQTSIGSPPVSPGSPGSGKTVSVFRSLMNNLKRSEAEDQGSGGNLERVTSKHSRRSDHLDTDVIRTWLQNQMYSLSALINVRNIASQLLTRQHVKLIHLTTAWAWNTNKTRLKRWILKTLNVH